MKSGTRSLWWRVVAVVLAAGAAAVTIFGVWLSPKDTPEAKASFVIAAWGIAAFVVPWAWKKASAASPGLEELGPLADQLAVAVENQWKKAAGERGLLEPTPIPVRWQRPDKPIAGPPEDAVGSKRFAPLPGVATAGLRRLRAGHLGELHELYGGLGSGRIVIAGKPGAGKSGAAVLLILAALDHRRSLSDSERARIPVPVMFTLHGWDPSNQKAHDWLAERLSQTYPMFEGRHGRGKAGDLLADGRITVILDGLDEIPKDMRPVALEALSQQATFRLILLTRSDEMVDAAKHELLQGAAAIEMQDVDARTAAAYLRSTQPHPPPHGWHKLITCLSRQPGGQLAQALNNPLMLTIVRETYRSGDDAGELLDLHGVTGHAASSEDIANHILDRVLPTAYAQRPGEPPPRYNGESVERVLRYIAARMNEDGTRDLQWWQISGWAHAGPRVAVTGLVLGLSSGLAFGLVFGLTGGLVAGFVLGLLAGVVAGIEAQPPRRMAPVQWRRLHERRSLIYGFGSGLVAGLSIGLGRSLTWGLAVGLVFGLFFWLLNAVVWTATDDTSPLSPLASWRSDRAFGLWWGLVFVFLFGFLGVLWWQLKYGFLTGPLTRVGLRTEPAWGLVIGLTSGLGIGIVACFIYSETWGASLAFVQLARSYGTPVRLMRFLEDARKRNVLRTVGPVYQFRHARLQDWLADKESVAAPDRVKPGPTAGGAEAPVAEVGTQARSAKPPPPPAS